MDGALAPSEAGIIVGEVLVFRDATLDDLAAVVALYADDELGASRETSSDRPDDAYVGAFHEIDRDPRHRLIVVEDDGDIVGTLQLSYIPHVVLRGGERAQIEAVRVRSDRRRTGLGEQMVEWVVEQAKSRGCRLVQLTTDAQRPAAHRFYERLGFRPSHVGMKRRLTDQ